MPSAKTSPDGVQGDAGRAEPDNCPTRRAYSSRYGGMMTAGTRAALLLTAFLLGSSLSASSGSAFGLVGNISAGLGEKWGSHLTFLNPINNRGTHPRPARMVQMISMTPSRRLGLRLASARRESGEPDPSIPMSEEASPESPV